MADAGRVVAGTAGGLRLVAPGAGTRPLADRVKQALFGVLDPDLAGSRFLDLFAGSGAAGIEALSRGAAHAVFVERDAGAARAIRQNLQRTGLAGERAEVVQGDVAAYLRRRAVSDGPFDLVFADPPYAERELLLGSLELLAAAEPALVSDAGRVVAKHFWRDRPPALVGLLASERERRFGETCLTFYRRSAASTERGPEEREA